VAYLDAVLDEQDAFPQKRSGGGDTEVIQRAEAGEHFTDAQVNEIVEKAVADAGGEMERQPGPRRRSADNSFRTGRWVCRS
jgi:hypothetical protein